MLHPTVDGKAAARQASNHTIMLQQPISEQFNKWIMDRIFPLQHKEMNLEFTNNLLLQLGHRASGYANLMDIFYTLWILCIHFTFLHLLPALLETGCPQIYLPAVLWSPFTFTTLWYTMQSFLAMLSTISLTSQINFVINVRFIRLWWIFFKEKNTDVTSWHLFTK